MQKDLIDSYLPGREIPHFALCLKLNYGANPRSFRENIYFDGLDKPSYNIIIAREPESSGQY